MLKAIIVDDEPYCCEILAAMLETDCPDVNVVNISGNAQDGLNAIKQYSPDIVFLDVEMPKMNGFDVLRMLAYGGQLYEKRVVILSALTLTNKEKEQMKGAGVTEILSKPFNPESIERFLGLIAFPTVADKE